ncbi:hypothetical protein MKY15_22640 [Sporosarcina sp. FSL K6-1540]|uniref:hypothetical protein n=1 Tax=Sporosarcina TaxID=1569 RepID=UPI00078DA77E|nr:hypothetical protein [Sporosarcina psychrophila]AMQ07063.1 hypothetical protein AZE41_14610 [Sporosarcina psychrophila]
MEERLTTSIVLYGEIDSFDSEKWLDFYKYVINFINSLNFEPNYMAVSGVSIKSSKITSLKRIERKFCESVEKGEEISSVSIYSLPEDYEIAAFDYNVYICRTNRLKYSHIIITLPNEIFDKVDYKGVIEELKKNIEFENGEVFKLLNLESPHLYASKANDPSSFKTLDVILKF